MILCTVDLCVLVDDGLGKGRMSKHQKISGMWIVQVISLSELLEGSVVQDGWDSSV